MARKPVSITVIEWVSALLVLLITSMIDQILAMHLLFLLLVYLVKNEILRVYLLIMGFVSIFYYLNYPCKCNHTELTKLIYAFYETL